MMAFLTKEEIQTERDRIEIAAAVKMPRDVFLRWCATAAEFHAAIEDMRAIKRHCLRETWHDIEPICDAFLAKIEKGPDPREYE